MKYVTKYVDELHRFNPKFEITSNWMYSTFFPKPVTAPLDFLSGDFTGLGSVNTARFEARYLASTGKPWDLMAWGFSTLNWETPYLPNINTFPLQKSAVQLQQESAVCISQGGGMQVYQTPTRAGWIDDTVIDTLAQVSKFCRARQKVSHKTETVPQIAVILS